MQQLLAETLVEQNDVQGAVTAFESALAALVDREDVAPAYRDAIRQRMAMLHLERNQHEEVRASLAELEMPEGPLATEIRCRLAIHAAVLAVALLLAPNPVAAEGGSGAPDPVHPSLRARLAAAAPVIETDFFRVNHLELELFKQKLEIEAWSEFLLNPLKSCQVAAWPDQS